MSSRHERSRPISEQAAEWLCLLNEGGAQEQSAFMAWLKQSPKHVEEFLLATATWRGLQQAHGGRTMGIDEIVAEVYSSGTPQRNVVEFSGKSTAPLFVRQKRRLKSWQLAAGVAGITLLGAMGWSLLNGATTYSTAVGEQRTVRLADGSVVQLNTASRARVHFTDGVREVELISGEALFTVARERTRPFRVASGGTLIQAVGTQFNVRRKTLDTQVSVIEGRVRIVRVDKNKEQPERLLGAGEEVRVGADGRIARNPAPDVVRTVAWRERRLVFRADRLADVVAEINRYSNRRFRIEGSRAQETRLTATFDVDQPDSLAAFLEKYSDLTVHSEGDGFVVGERTKTPF